MVTILLVILVIALLFGGFGHARDWGPLGWSPLGVVVLVLLIFWLTGHLR
ncbi:MAG: DUF3309 family protein [Rhodanobacteraceae bacterium]|nr:DUF3309 family protein [Rhodanobacteraceae bacterium]